MRISAVHSAINQVPELEDCEKVLAITVAAGHPVPGSSQVIIVIRLRDGERTLTAEGPDFLSSLERAFQQHLEGFELIGYSINSTSAFGVGRRRKSRVQIRFGKRVYVGEAESSNSELSTASALFYAVQSALRAHMS